MMEITENCINCAACMTECPRDAVFESGEYYFYNNIEMKPLSYDHFFISTEICDGCAMLNRKKCVDVCPMDTIKEI